LKQTCGDGVEVRCFDNLMTAITDFVEQTRVRADKLPNKQRSKEIEKQIHDLPPFRGWDDVAQVVAHQWGTRPGFNYSISAGTARPLAAISTPAKEEGEQ